ncbi:MAG: prolyl oligopeptidase family serine peptidase, partial [Firmicutes bacterium]|nr:prolyl oligopeptidase family serine peptidase [Bacillota bacterium]
MKRLEIKDWFKKTAALALVAIMTVSAVPMDVFAQTAEIGAMHATEHIQLDSLYRKIDVKKGQVVPETKEIKDSEIYGYVIDYKLKKGHVLSISDTDNEIDYVFSVRQLVDGDYTTFLKAANTTKFTATEDMTVAMLIRKPDKSAVTAEELQEVTIYDSQYGMIGVDGYAQRFTVEAETIDGSKKTTRCNIFLPKSYSETGKPTKLVVMTNGYSAFLTDSTWNKNSADNVGIIQKYLNAGYAVYVVDNTAGRTVQTPDLGCPQLVDSYLKAYEYIQKHFNVEKKFSIHSRSFGTFAAMRIMREVPELVKCGLMTGPRVSLKLEYKGVDKAFVANRFGFTDPSGTTYEADKMIGHDPYTDVDEVTYELPPTYWIMSKGDSTTEPLTVIAKLKEHGNDVKSITHTGTDHTGVCTLNSDAMFEDALEYLEAYQEESIEQLALRYDDHYDITGKTVEIIDAGTPTSYQVGYGVEENTVRDTRVVSLEGDAVVATGVGSATVKIDGELYEVTVEAAPISLLLLIGQSNMRGSEGNADQSIVCPDGMVYPTYGDDRREDNTAMTATNAANFAPSALTGTYSTINVNGTTDCISGYPVNSLT